MANLSVPTAIVIGSLILALAHYMKPTSYESCWKTNETALRSLSSKVKATDQISFIAKQCSAVSQ